MPMTSNTCDFMGIRFTQIDGATTCRPESASVTDIYGAVFLDSRFKENVMNEVEDSKYYRDVFQYFYQQAKKEKLKKLNE